MHIVNIIPVNNTVILGLGSRSLADLEKLNGPLLISQVLFMALSSNLYHIVAD